MATDPLDYQNDDAKWEACGRLEERFKAAIGEIDEVTVHVEVKPRWETNATGDDDYVQVVQDDHMAQVVKDVNTLGNVGTLDLTENDITDATVNRLKELRHLSELWLTSTKITAKGVAVLKKALPHTAITHDTAD